MDCYKSIGWMHDSEWKAVYYNLYYGDEREIRAALDQMAVWRARFVKKVPVAIEATSQLFESRQFVGDENCMVKRQCMATAISQFLGLLTERTLKGNFQRRPIHALGLELGIPEWFTSLRNDIAHGSLPSFWMLNTAVDYALDWLKYNYWEKELDEIEEKCNEATDSWENRVIILSFFKSCLSSTEDTSSLRSSIEKLQNLVHSKPVMGFLLCSVLFENNFITLDSKFPPSNLFSPTKKLQLKSGAQNLMEKIINLLAESHALNRFFDELVDRMKFGHPPYLMFYFWMDFTIQILRSNKKLRKYVNWSQLVTTCIESRVRPRCVESMIEISEMKSKGLMVDLSRCISGSHDSSASTFDENVMTEKYRELLGALKVFKNNETRSDVVNVHVETFTEEMEFNVCSGDLSNCSLGLMPGQDPEKLWEGLCSNALKSVRYFVPQQDKREDKNTNLAVTECLTLKDLQYIKSEIDLY